MQGKEQSEGDQDVEQAKAPLFVYREKEMQKQAKTARKERRQEESQEDAIEADSWA